MAVLKKEDLLNAIKEIVGDDTSDKTITFIENVTDTIEDFETRTNDSENWKTRYEENDKAWREKYKDRFFGNKEDIKEDFEEKEEEETDTPKTFDDLFKTE